MTRRQRGNLRRQPVHVTLRLDVPLEATTGRPLHLRCTWEQGKRALSSGRLDIDPRSVFETVHVKSTNNNSTSAAVSAKGLRKAYGENVVLDGVDLTIGEGEVFSLLGPNGAGKTLSEASTLG